MRVLSGLAVWFCLSQVFGLLAAAHASEDDYVYCWLEAEDFTTATQGIAAVESARARLSTDDERSSAYFLGKGGRPEGLSTAVSGRGYMVRTSKGKEREYAQYDFSLPRKADYYIWLRFNNPPPCMPPLSLWYDSVASRTLPVGMGLGIWGVWVWYGWEQGLDNSKPKPHALREGENRLFIGDMRSDAKFDKILITDNPRYVPFGASESYYTSTFSPPAWRRSAHGMNDQARATDTGWEPVPAKAWEVVEEPVSDNWLYQVAPLSSATLAHSLIRKFEAQTFEASLKCYRQAAEPASGSDALLLFGWTDPSNYNAARLGSHSADILEVRQGVEHILATAPFAFEARKAPYDVRVRRTRDCLSLSVDGRDVGSLRAPYPQAGQAGLGTTTGGVAFDDVVVSPLDDPESNFDLFASEDKALGDWVLVRDAKESRLATKSELRKGDLLLYKAPSWSDSEVKVSLKQGERGAFSVLFPYASADRFVETRLNYGASGAIGLELIRHLGGEAKSCAVSTGTLAATSAPCLSFQCIKGLFAVFLDGKRVLETNEYDLLEGTMAFAIHDDRMACPVREVAIRRKNMIVDNFCLSEGGHLDSMWQTTGGDWKIAPVLDGDWGDGDGQLTIRGPGTTLLGKETWRAYLLQVSVLVSDSSEVALLGWNDRQADRSLELFCRPGEIQFRKVVAGNPLVLARTSVPSLTPGWHRLGFALGQDGLVGEVDGSECLRMLMPSGKGCAGLRNYAGPAAFDNLTVHIVAEERERNDVVGGKDEGLVDIEDAMLK